MEELMSGSLDQPKSLSRYPRYCESFKRKLVREYERGGISKADLQRKYKIGGHSRLSEWCRKYGKLYYDCNDSRGRPMKDPQKRRIKELEKALESERFKVIAYEKLIEISNREDGTNITKKDVAKQLANLRKSTQEG